MTKPTRIDVDIEEALGLSYKNFHAKGLDYVCAAKTELGSYLKFYILDGDVTTLPEVVNPHDHRYDFDTTVLAGEMIDRTYVRVPPGNEVGEVYSAFDWDTPLLGGAGFTFREEVRLQESDPRRLTKGDHNRSLSTDTHTIKMSSDRVVMMLLQHPDVVPVGTPTTAYAPSGVPEPDTSGLYERFTEAELIERLRLIESVAGSVVFRESVS